VGLLLLLPAAWAPADSKGDEKGKDKEATPKEQYDALLKEVNKQQRDIVQEYNKAKDQAERQKILARYYALPAKFAGRFFKLAEDNPKDPAALDALVWVVTQNYEKPPAAVDKAVDILVKDHVKSEAIGKVCMQMVYSRSPKADKLLEAVLEKNPKKEVQGQAAYVLGMHLKTSKPKEAEKLLERAAKDAADVKMYGTMTIGKLAKGELFEMRHLAIGKTAPDIKGEDIDGKEFKLSDYKGKVVVLDFWGHW
jgi:hypothetical protein